MKKAVNLFEIPYRIESLEDISEAIRTNFLGIGSQYLQMHALAKKVGSLDIPPALSGAREFVRKAFLRVDEKKIRQCDLDYGEIANLPLVENFSAIEHAIPCAAGFAGHDHLFALLGSFPEEVRRVCKIGPANSLLGAYESIRAIRGLLQKEILAYARTRRTKQVGVEELKRLMVAYTLFQPGNEDVLQALRASSRNGSNPALRQNAIAELLFCRLPRFVEGLTRVEPKRIRKKLLSKLMRLDLTANQRTNLLGFFEPNIGDSDLLPVLDRTGSIARRITLAEGTRQRLCDYIGSLANDVVSIRRLYDSWFLTSELRRMRRIYSPRNVMEYQLSIQEDLVRTLVHDITLTFYPTKDWLDYCKGKTSSDCSVHHFGKEHLLAPAFFNVRIFHESEWIGNIYMLDYTRENGCLLVDRIQIPRGIQAGYVQFFDTLQEVFEELFEDVGYEHILLPLRISNHASVQKAFNGYKKGLEKESVRFPHRNRNCFESLSQKGKYYVLTSRAKQQPLALSGEIVAQAEMAL